MAESLQKELIRIPSGAVEVEGLLEVPERRQGIILFAHGSGSSRHSPRNNYVAELLRDRGLGTLMMDLLTPEEEQKFENRFDISLLTERLTAASDWLQDHFGALSTPLGLFGASTGAAAAMQVAAMPGTNVAAVVSRGGRPDLAGPAALEKVAAPTLLIVGELDRVVMELNRAAFKSIGCEKRLEIVPGAGHLFEEPGKLAVVAKLAGDWFLRHLAAPPSEPEVA